LDEGKVVPVSLLTESIRQDLHQVVQSIRARRRFSGEATHASRFASSNCSTASSKSSNFFVNGHSLLFSGSNANPANTPGHDPAQRQLKARAGAGGPRSPLDALDFSRVTFNGQSVCAEFAHAHFATPGPGPGGEPTRPRICWRFSPTRVLSRESKWPSNRRTTAKMKALEGSNPPLSATQSVDFWDKVQERLSITHAETARFSDRPREAGVRRAGSV